MTSDAHDETAAAPDAGDTAGTGETTDEVLAPVPDPSDDLSELAVFAHIDDEAAPEVGPQPVSDPVAADSPAEVAGYDVAIDIAVPVHETETQTAFTPYGASVPPALQEPGYDVGRDTGM